MCEQPVATEELYKLVAVPSSKPTIVICEDELRKGVTIPEDGLEAVFPGNDVSTVIVAVLPGNEMSTVVVVPAYELMAVFPEQELSMVVLTSEDDLAIVVPKILDVISKLELLCAPEV
ncbi:hypothetical protein BPAE_0404g00020 [Botrytis paeoniae]|uniref:Uncharacterized protein n=1 Tax=Botrytis paeoniae TaxID=278948 RepID=A0A4Z1F8V6_9HELO|nr:hypothetical protein BPAE_0404g00020 [Botrytis paeoniae]